MNRFAFDKLQWFPDRVVIGNLVLRLEHTKTDQWDGGDHLMFYKVKGLLEQYESFFNSFPDFYPGRILELGMWDGGSTLLWSQLLQPEKIVGIDLKDRQDSSYFQNFINSNKLQNRVATFWNTNQADKNRLRKIVASEFGEKIDLVIDDCSHLCAPTKASFEALFPLLHPGGWYIIEDWAWGHWPNYITPNHPWALEIPLTEFVIELVKGLGSNPDMISSIYIQSGFAAIRRGSYHFDEPSNYILEKHIVRYPRRPAAYIRLRQVPRQLVQLARQILRLPIRIIRKAIRLLSRRR